MARVINRLISLSIGASGVPVDRSNEVSNFTIDSVKSDSDFLSFAEARAGAAPKIYTCVFTLVQDHSIGSLWDLIWSHHGEIASGVWAPYGNDVPTTDQPHFNWTAIIVEPVGVIMGGASNTSTMATSTVEVTWNLIARPTKVTA